METELHRIRCPHCLFGAAYVEVKRAGAGYMEFDYKQTLSCDRCQRPFRIRPRVKLVGVPLEGA